MTTKNIQKFEYAKTAKKMNIRNLKKRKKNSRYCGAAFLTKIFSKGGW